MNFEGWTKTAGPRQWNKGQAMLDSHGVMIPPQAVIHHRSIRSDGTEVGLLMKRGGFDTWKTTIHVVLHVLKFLMSPEALKGQGCHRIGTTFGYHMMPGVGLLNGMNQGMVSEDIAILTRDHRFYQRKIFLISGNAHRSLVISEMGRWMGR